MKAGSVMSVPMTSASSVQEYTETDQPASVRPNANTAYIAITALVSLSSVCILLLTSNRPDLWPTVAMIGALCGFGGLISYFVTRGK